MLSWSMSLSPAAAATRFPPSARLVEIYEGCFLTQIQTNLFILAVDNKRQQASHGNQVQNDQRVKNILHDFPKVTRVSSSGYSRSMV